MKIRNWNRFQHYKRRNPPWIRVYADIIDDPSWYELSAPAKAFLIEAWLVASQHAVDGTLPDSKALARRLHIDSKTLQALISECKQWLVLDDSTMLADCKQVARPETESETESETEAESETDKIPPPKRRGASVTLCPEDWTPSPDDISWARGKGFLPVQIENATESMIYWSRGNGKKRARWDLVWRNWLKREGAASRVGASSDQNSAAKWSKIREQSRHIDFDGSGKRGDDANAIVPGHSESPPRDADRLIQAVSINHEGEDS